MAIAVEDEDDIAAFADYTPPAAGGAEVVEEAAPPAPEPTPSAPATSAAPAPAEPAPTSGECLWVGRWVGGHECVHVHMCMCVCVSIAAFVVQVNAFCQVQQPVRSPTTTT